MSKYVHSITSGGQTGGDPWLCIVRPPNAKTTPIKKRFHFQKSVGSESA